MRKFVISTLAIAVVSAGSALAADLPLRSPPPAPMAPLAAPPPAFTWEGGYVGYNAGYNWRRNSNQLQFNNPLTQTYFVPTSMTSIARTAAAQRLSRGSFAAGVQAGYNWQVGALAYGVEADFNYMRSTQNAASRVAYPCCAPAVYLYNQSVRTNWLATLRGRYGYAAGPALVYVTGGLAAADVRYGRSFADNFAPVPLQVVISSSTRLGWALGGGVEFAVSNNVSLKGEYLYADFGRVRNTSNIGSLVTAVPANATASLRVRHHIFRAGVNYRFNGS